MLYRVSHDFTHTQAWKYALTEPAGQQKRGELQHVHPREGVAPLCLEDLLWLGERSASWP